VPKAWRSHVGLLSSGCPKRGASELFKVPNDKFGPKGGKEYFSI